MKTAIKINKTSRNVLLNFIEKNTLEQLNTIPEGYTNNLIWNIGHIIVVQQLLTYKLSGLSMQISNEIVEKYKKGTKPEVPVTQVELEELKSLLFSTLEKTEKDIDAAVFNTYQEFTTMTGFHCQSAKDAIIFNNFHEGIHIGIMMRIQKLV